jgi:cytidine deaminase
VNRKPIEHGSPRGYAAERRRGLEPCGACREAHTAAERKRRTGTEQPRELIACPSEAAYSRHRRRDEEPCRGCRDAHAEYARLNYRPVSSRGAA